MRTITLELTAEEATALHTAMQNAAVPTRMALAYAMFEQKFTKAANQFNARAEKVEAKNAKKKKDKKRSARARANGTAGSTDEQRTAG